MKANYHTHTRRCNHAVGTEAEYIHAAIGRGLETLGFSDHTPYLFPGDYYSTFRMRPEELEEYVSCLTGLRQDFQGQIQIPIGLEAEFYPAYFPALLPRLRDAGVEYLILGQHFVDNEINAHYSGSPTASTEILKRYCHQVMDAFQTGLFTYLAHPDLINFQGNPRDYEQQMRVLCQEAKSCNIPLEYNLLGAATKRHYPNEFFWKIAAEEGNTVVIGCDAHDPQALAEISYENKAREILASYGICPVEVPKLQPIK